MKLFRAKTFKKDYQRLKISDIQYAKYIGNVPLEARNHTLIGNYSGFKEFHIGGDVLVVYYVEDDIIRLTRIGTHAQIFK